MEIHLPADKPLVFIACSSPLPRWLEGRGAGQQQVNFKLRDWLFARQRYWGEPFPIVFPEGSDVRVVVLGLPAAAVGNLFVVLLCREPLAPPVVDIPPAYGGMSTAHVLMHQFPCQIHRSRWP